jgi:predicted PurR-regulated permease PerM
MSTRDVGWSLDGLPNRGTAFWWAVAALAAVLLLFVGYRYVGTFALGLFVYYSTRPINDRIEARYGGARRSALVSLLVIVLPYVVVLALVVVAVVNAVAGLQGLVAASLTAALGPYVDAFAAVRTPREAFEYASTALSDATVQGGIDTALAAFGTLGGLLFNTFLIAAFVYFLLRDDARLSAWVTGELLDEDTAFVRYLRAVDEDLESVYYGQMLTIFAVIAISIVLYGALNLVAPPGMDIPQVVLFAALTGIATFIPLVGRGVVYVGIAAYLSFVAVTTDPVLLWYPFVFLVVTFWGLDNLVRYFVRPRLAGRTVPASLLLFTYLLGAGIWGWYGVFLAPLLFVLVWEFLRTVFPALLHGESLTGGAPPTDLPPPSPAPGDEEYDEEAGPSPSDD